MSSDGIDDQKIKSSKIKSWALFQYDKWINVSILHITSFPKIIRELLRQKPSGVNTHGI